MKLHLFSVSYGATSKTEADGSSITYHYVGNCLAHSKEEAFGAATLECQKNYPAEKGFHNGYVVASYPADFIQLLKALFS